MKHTLLSGIILALLAVVGYVPAKAQHALSSSQLATARKKAVAEAAMYQKKGFKVYHSSAGMQTLIENFYKDTYREISPGQRVYLWAMSTGKSSTATGAETQALQKAKKHLPGLVLMYFNAWTSANTNLSESDKKLMTSAINKAESGINDKIMALPPNKKVTFIKSKKGQYQAAVRVLYKQLPLRELARTEIKKQLRKSTHWPESKMDQSLHFEK